MNHSKCVHCGAVTEYEGLFSTTRVSCALCRMKIMSEQGLACMRDLQNPYAYAEPESAGRNISMPHEEPELTLEGLKDYMTEQFTILKEMFPAPEPEAIQDDGGCDNDYYVLKYGSNGTTISALRNQKSFDNLSQLIDYISDGHWVGGYTVVDMSAGVSYVILDDLRDIGVRPFSDKAKSLCGEAVGKEMPDHYLWAKEFREC